MHNLPAQYSGLYKDNFSTERIVIANDYDLLSVVIDGVKFEGREFSDLVLIDRSAYSEQQLQRFTFFPVSIYQTDIIEETLCNCSFAITIPQIIVDKQKNVPFLSDVSVDYQLGDKRPGPKGGIDFEQVTLSLVINEITYTGKGGDFESAFDQLHAQFGEQYRFKNCYGCMYGDYGVGGNSSFGTKLCFENQKEQYEAVTNKSEYMSLSSDCERVQEIYLCDRFKIRRKGAGYRG